MPVMNRKITLSELGKDLRNARNLDEALVLAGADYTVTKAPLYYKKAGEFEQAPEAYGTFRVDLKNKTSNFIAPVGPDYTVSPNRKNFEICQAMVNAGRGRWIRGWVSPDGGMLSIRMQVQEARILGDAVGGFADVFTGHNGRICTHVKRTLERLVCWNGLTVGRQDMSLKIRHTSGIKNLEQTVKTLHEGSALALQRLRETAEELVKIQISEERFGGIVDALLPLPSEAGRKLTNTQERRSLLWKAFTAEDLQNFLGTGWAAYNAVTDYAQHMQGNSKMTEENMVGRLMQNNDGDSMIRTALVHIYGAK